MQEGRITITVKYSCNGCGLIDADCQVDARPSEKMDVRHWLENICAHTVAADHAYRSPECKAVKMANLKIPMGGADYIGGPLGGKN